MLQAIDLSKYYGKSKALNTLNLTVNDGQIYCLLGANGAGKTTTINQKLTKDTSIEILLSVGVQVKAIHQRVSKYSKGMRQKVGIAIAKAKQAEILLLDEPTSGLDPKSSNEFTELLQLQASQHVAILMTTHDLFLADI